jgi:predicted component of type VI protein secretion system
MTVTCSNGHQSATTDYCDQCGAKIEGAAAAPAAAEPAAAPVAAAAPPSSAAPTSAAPSSVSTAQPCPVCATPRAGDDRFCEGCGFDFESGTGGSIPAATATPAAEAALWEVVASADREYFDRMAPEGVSFPPHCPDRTFGVAGEQVRIGRRSPSRGVAPEIDLSGAPEDPAISHLHALLLRQPDGSYAVVDPGSTNGTTVNDGKEAITVNEAVPLKDGDRIHLGAWTTLTVHSRP